VMEPYLTYLTLPSFWQVGQIGGPFLWLH
jgi:hypothetical protein